MQAKGVAWPSWSGGAPGAEASPRRGMPCSSWSPWSPYLVKGVVLVTLAAALAVLVAELIRTALRPDADGAVARRRWARLRRASAAATRPGHGASRFDRLSAAIARSSPPRPALPRPRPRRAPPAGRTRTGRRGATRDPSRAPTIGAAGAESDAGQERGDRQPAQRHAGVAAPRARRRQRPPPASRPTAAGGGAGSESAGACRAPARRRVTGRAPARTAGASEQSRWRRVADAGGPGERGRTGRCPPSRGEPEKEECGREAVEARPDQHSLIAGRPARGGVASPSCRRPTSARGRGGRATAGSTRTPGEVGAAGREPGRRRRGSRRRRPGERRFDAERDEYRPADVLVPSGGQVEPVDAPHPGVGELVHRPEVDEHGAVPSALPCGPSRCRRPPAPRSSTGRAVRDRERSPRTPAPSHRSRQRSHRLVHPPPERVDVEPGTEHVVAAGGDRIRSGRIARAAGTWSAIT